MTTFGEHLFLSRSDATVKQCLTLRYTSHSGLNIPATYGVHRHSVVNAGIRIADIRMKRNVIMREVLCDDTTWYSAHVCRGLWLSKKTENLPPARSLMCLYQEAPLNRGVPTTLTLYSYMSSVLRIKCWGSQVNVHGERINRRVDCFKSR